MNDSAPTVFIVDDDPSVLKALARLLRSPTECDYVRSPQEFLDNHDQNVPAAWYSMLQCPTSTAWNCNGHSPLRAANYRSFSSRHGDIR